MRFSSVPYDHYSEVQRAEIGYLLSILVSQHYRISEPVFAELERRGVFLGNGRFVVVVVQTRGHALYGPPAAALSRDLERCCRELLRTPLYYAAEVGGLLHLILCYPRAENTQDARAEIAGQLREDLWAILRRLEPSRPEIQILASDVFWGERELYLAANSLHHAMEYYAFRTQSPQVIQLDTEEQLHGGYVEDLYLYRRLSNQMAERLAVPECDGAALGNLAVDAVLAGGGVSMESLHHHIQIFMLTFSEHLSESGLVDSAYIQSHHIVRRSMGFETEAQLRAVMGALMGELHQQYLTLSAIGQRGRVQQVRDYVLANISDPDLSVQSLSHQFSITPSHLTRQFQRYFDVTLRQFIQNARLQQAKTLIAAHPDWPLKRIGEAAGYLDVSTMYRAFQRLDGTTPGVVRRKTAR